MSLTLAMHGCPVNHVVSIVRSVCGHGQNRDVCYSQQGWLTSRHALATSTIPSLIFIIISSQKYISSLILDYTNYNFIYITDECTIHTIKPVRTKKKTELSFLKIIKQHKNTIYIYIEGKRDISKLCKDKCVKILQNTSHGPQWADARVGVTASDRPPSMQLAPILGHRPVCCRMRSLRRLGSGGGIGENVRPHFSCSASSHLNPNAKNQKYERNATKYWDDFYKRHQGKVRVRHLSWTIYRCS